MKAWREQADLADAKRRSANLIKKQFREFIQNNEPTSLGLPGGYDPVFIQRWKTVQAAAKVGEAGGAGVPAAKLHADGSILARELRAGGAPIGGEASRLEKLVENLKQAAQDEKDADEIGLKIGPMPAANLKEQQAANATVNQDQIAELQKRTADPNLGVLERQDIQNRIAQLLPKGAAPVVPPSPVVGSPAHETIEGAAKAAGVPEKEFHKGIWEAAQKMGVDPADPVAFPIALQKMLNRPEFADARVGFEELGQTDLQAEQQQQTTQTAQQQPVQDVRTQKNEEIRATLTKLAATKDIDNWAEAIAFVLLSMIISPKMAILFFSRSSERGELRAHAGFLRQQVAQIDQEQRAAQQQAEWDRRTVIEHQLRGQEKEESDARDFRAKWFLLQQKAATEKKNPTVDPVVKSLQQDLDNWASMAQKAGQALDYERAKIYMDQADGVLQKMAKIKGQTGAPK